VYEAARELAEIGAGVGTWPRAWRILQTLGLAEDLSHHAVVPPLDRPSKSEAAALARLGADFTDDRRCLAPLS
jgi:2-polyprenyl-6-methoxyphenol hydroxylase-like FAD-dependent oxidoreductase